MVLGCVASMELRSMVSYPQDRPRLNRTSKQGVKIAESCVLFLIQSLESLERRLEMLTNVAASPPLYEGQGLDGVRECVATFDRVNLSNNHIEIPLD